MRRSTAKRFEKLVRETQAERERVLKCVARGDWRAAEDNVARRADYQIRELKLMADDARSSDAREAQQGDTEDFQSVAFLNEGSDIRRCVAQVDVDTEFSTLEGTGFLISPRLFLTNQHVIMEREYAEATTVTFDYELDRNRNRLVPTVYRLDPATFEYYSPELDLDFALIALGEKVSGPSDVSDFGYVPISNTPNRHQKGMNANIIQHPGGALKKIAVRNNIITNRTDKYLLYKTDTLKGSSGAPVFNDDWDLVAVHHYGAPSGEIDEDGNVLPREINEGIRISAIFERLEEERESLPEHMQELLDEALSLFEENTTALPQVVTRNLSERENKSISTEVEPMGRGTRRARFNEDGTATFVIPLEVSVRMPGALREDGSPAQKEDERSDLARSELPQLSSQEGKRLDRNFSNRNGYQSDFITGFDADLSEILNPVKKRIQPLKENQDDHKSGILDYQNFSVVMDSETRFALLTATNIDDAKYKKIDRKTGELKREGESWYIERRIDRDAFIDQDFYSDWSHIFDRGHLTRRNDPTWGTIKEAKRANADTFHFTNCSPQHWRFNQSKKIWQGIERYILEKGVSDNKSDTRVSVLQGPLFTDGFDEESRIFADDVMIPLAFWKLVFWKKGRKKKVVAMIASQEGMLSEERGGKLGEKKNMKIKIEEFRVSVEQLEERTGMDFSAFREFDTIHLSSAPDVAEASGMQRLRSLSDIQL